MKKIIYNIVLILGVVFIMFACSDMDEMQLGSNNMKKHTCIMKFDAEAPSFESDSVTTRASGTSWENGDEIFIYFSESAYGQGQYSATDNQWTLDYYGSLDNGSGKPCTVYYVKGGSQSGTIIGLNAQSAVYADEDASYYLSSNTLTLKASIKPYCTRVRFKGEAGQNFALLESSEIKYYTQIDFSNNQCQSEGKTLSLTVNSDGYTDFLYVAPLTSDATLSLFVGKSIYTRTLSTSFFSLGASGVFQIPSSVTLYGWQQKERSSAYLVTGKIFNQKIRALAGDPDDSFDTFTKSDKIKEIIFDYNSNVSNGELISDYSSGVPIYANFSNGIITISTAADIINVTDMGYMFYGCRKLASLDLSSFDTSNVTDMREMFYGCRSLTSLDLSSFDTSNVTDMNSMFLGCYSLTSLDLSSFDTSNVTNMGEMFSSCNSLTSVDLSSFDTSNVTYMRSMFYGCSSLTSLDLSSFDTSNVTTMYSMFIGCNSLTSLDLSSFDTRNVTTMVYMFDLCRSLASLDLSSFDTSNVKYMGGMFNGCSSLTSLDLSSFDTRNVTDMGSMFYGCSSLTSLDLRNFDTSNVTYMYFMFRDVKNCIIRCTKATKQQIISSGTDIDDTVTFEIV